MPPIHRMPIAYLAFLILAIVAGLAFQGIGPSPSTERPPPQDGFSNSQREPTTWETSIEATPEPAEPILRTAEGLRRKILIKNLGVIARRTPGVGRPIGEPLDYFSIHYVLADPTSGSDMIQIGDSTGRSIGWVPRDSVLEWDTRLMARPLPREGRPPLVLYREARCLREALGGRPCPEHGEHCPIEGQESVEAPQVPPAIGMPILATRSFSGPDGHDQTIFEVASLVRDQAPIVPPKEPPPGWIPWLKRVEVVFVIDSTASMRSAIEGVRRLAESLIEAASERYQDVTLRCALIEFRDKTPTFAFSVRRVTDFTDPRTFRQALDQVEAAAHGDGSIDETVLDGVEAALPDHAGLERLRWSSGRTGMLATRLIILIGDSPDHDPGADRARELAQRARSARVSIASVAIERPGFLQGDEQTRYRDQWEALAEGSYRPADSASGFAEPIAPLVLQLDAGADTIASRLRILLDDRVARAREMAALALAEAEGRLQQYTDSRGLTMNQVTTVLADLHRGESETSRRHDPRLEDRVAPSVRRGWVAKAWNGQPLVQVEILLSRAELGQILHELTQLQQAVQGESRDLSDLLRIGTAAATGEVTFLGRDRGSETLADYLHRRRGLPPPRPDSLLQRSQADLLQADDLFRAAIVRRLQSSIARLLEFRDSPLWNDPRRVTSDGLAPVPYDPLDF